LSEYLTRCWNCLGEFDAMAAVWCSCNPNRPTKVCPFCLQCFCSAPEEYHERFWASSPEELVKDREMLTRARGPLGEALVMARAITSDQLLLALKQQKDKGGKLGQILVDMGFLNQETLEAFLARHRPVMNLSLHETALDHMLVTVIGAEECLKRLVVPISKEKLATKELLTLAMANPADGETIELIQNMTGCQILPMRATREEIMEALTPFLSLQPEPQAAPSEPSAPATGAQMATDLLRKALARGASDLYLEPKEDEVSIHLRIDGALYRAKAVGKDLQETLTLELKRLLRLDSSEVDRPQEGRVVMRSGAHRFEVIAHCLPTRFGENISLKFINRDTFLKTFDKLGMPSDDQRSLRTVLSARHGLILVTAPLFHGSTTTLYGVMNDLASDPQRKIMSIEAQSVCPVPNVSQVSLGDNKDAEATHTTLKALANIQPDVCILGDIFDSSTMATQILKFVGQMLVVATLEATHSVHAVQRVLELGVPPADLSQHLLLVINQRLVRQICPHCAEPADFSNRTLRMMGLKAEEAATLTAVFQGRGCEECSNIGYKGRLSLFETLVPTAAFRKAVARSASAKMLEREALKGDMVSLRVRALQAVQDGKTTIEEFQKCNF
jgi:type II secretory ATPase GspE/PulE/Tfp pilus assembly ATPase PilB-like protein